MSTKFSDESLAVKFLENVYWPNGPVCCEGYSFWELKGENYREGRRKCQGCKRIFSIRESTPFKGTRTKLHKWLRVTTQHFSLRNVSTKRIASDIDVNWKTVQDMREVLNSEERRSLVAHLVAALQPSVAEQLMVPPPIAKGASHEKIESGQTNGEPSTLNEAVPHLEGTIRNGAGTGVGSWPQTHDAVAEHQQQRLTTS